MLCYVVFYSNLLYCDIFYPILFVYVPCLCLAVPYVVTDFLKGMTPRPSDWDMDTTAEREKIAPAWKELWKVIHKYGGCVGSSGWVEVSGQQWVGRSEWAAVGG
jgi:hypothetical protein